MGKISTVPVASMILPSLRTRSPLAKAAAQKRGAKARCVSVRAGHAREEDYWMSTNSVSTDQSETRTDSADHADDGSGLGMSRSAIDAHVKSILVDVLGIQADQAEGFDADTGLFGHLPELDSMAVASLLTEMEDRLDIVIEDDDVDGEMLETYGGLLAFAECKVIEG